jgi:hypothetical protein
MSDAEQNPHFSYLMNGADPVRHQEEFLAKLSRLSIEYKIRIGGCGCCGSPFLQKLDAETGLYEVDERGDGLIFVGQPRGET